MTLLCDDSGLKFGAWRKPDSYLGGAKPESCKTGSFFLQPWRCRLLLLFAPILHRSEPHFRIRMETQFILAQKTEAIGENGDFFHLRYVNDFFFALVNTPLSC
uniref:Uncharacterized protein n=1 Tax=Spongospora subterranea TaxID=70186 RepID=A0A0H5RCN6_9EUKA|eukprot:CRZ06274.1 hypothetical protein [Spongospora subterranea]